MVGSIAQSAVKIVDSSVNRDDVPLVKKFFLFL